VTGIRSERGAISAEHVAILVVVGAVLAAVVALALPSRVATAGAASVACLFDGGCDARGTTTETTREAGASREASDSVEAQAERSGQPAESGATADDAAGGPRDPAPSPTEVAAAAASDDDPHSETTSILDETEVGREFLDQLERHPIDIDYVHGQGAFWNGRRIQIDASWAAEDMAATLIHELTHDLDGRIEGERPHPDHFSDQQAYLEAMAAFEVRAMVNEIRFYDELAEARGEEYEPTRRDEWYASLYGPAAEQAYEETYAGWVDAESVTLFGYEFVFGSDEQRDAYARARAELARDRATYDALMAEFLDGNMVGSNSGRAYVDVWADRWDEAQRGCGFLWYRCW
jgi:hypothetical protein